jgi:branched-chain amino acid transport system ATP-binding protein
MTTSTEAILVADGVHVHYGLSHALSNVSLDLAEGYSLAVVGANGAGKSSLARALSGLVTPVAGRIHFAGHDVTGWAPDKIRRLGLTFVPEGRGVFPSLSVFDNLRMAVRWLDTKAERRSGIERVVEFFPVLAKRRNQRAGTLSGGEQQMLSLARALAVWPRVLIVDEMSLGLAPMIVDAMFEQLRAAREAGVTIVLIEQFVHRALDFADQVVVLRKGSVAWAGSAKSIGQQEILSQYMGKNDAGKGVSEKQSLAPSQ